MSQFYYFTNCCGNEQPFGIISGKTSSWTGFNNPVVGNQYGIIIGSYSGCVTYSGSSSSSLNSINLRTNSNVTFLLYNDCELCNDIFPCYTPPPVVTPIITGYKNECGIITILPMVVECVVSNPSVFGVSDGEISVSITGGTPPYTTSWSNGNISPAIGGLGNGTYTATTVDYYGDYTATTVCTINTEPVCTFFGSIEEILIDCIDAGLSGYTFDLS